MTAFFLPSGTITTATLYRPVRGLSFVGSAMIVAANQAVGAKTLQLAMLHKSADLLAGVPELLPPGPPVSLLVQFVTPDLALTPSVFSWSIERATRRADLAVTVFGGIDDLMQSALANLQAQMSARAMAAAANAAGSDARN